MRLNYIPNNKMPPMAWIAICNNSIINVIHGDKVECLKDFFVEGAWDGDFANGDFVNSEWFCGTGAQITGSKIVFSTPSHIIGGIYYIKTNNQITVSNSMCLLMAYNNLYFDAQHLYETDFNTILKGVKDYKKEIYTLNQVGEKVNINVLYYRNLIIDSANECYVTIKPPVKSFSDFGNYSTRLEQAMINTCNNGRDIKRKYKYDLTTTISKGYDAPCCAAIAKKCGCDTAVTFSAEGKYADDCGSEIAKLLGYTNIKEKNPDKFLKREDFIEAYYIAAGELGADISFSAFDDEFKGRIVFTGERGDSVWGRNSSNRNNNFVFNGRLSLLGSVERRLWIGYISIPMPLYGATAWESIYEISNSSAMKKWQLNNSYDRPIPRRILEQLGVPRNSFGIEKHGAGFTYCYDWIGSVEKKMSATSFSDFKKFVSENRRFYVLQYIKYFFKTRHIYFSALGFKVHKKDSFYYSQIPNPLAPRYLIPWAAKYVVSQYSNILKEE